MCTDQGTDIYINFPDELWPSMSKASAASPDREMFVEARASVALT